MKFTMFVHNDDAKCFHVAIQGTHKLVVMGCINFKDHVLIKRWQKGKKMNVMGGKFKVEKKWGTNHKKFTFVVGSCAHFSSSGVHSSMNVESAIEKL